ncbi:ribbon-helix-helix domain-containing protein [Parageobacillus thermoglucosidasius]|uniref:ribbon-helix-helix domain-containing protein n=1 Tax=Parageobacillus thermoglucosidasius TaxID=1426 RepID=UPI0030C6CB38
MAAEMVRVNTRISTEINDWLDKYSARTGVPKSTIIHMALENYIMQKRAIDSLEVATQRLNKLDVVIEKLNKIEERLSSEGRSER